MTWRAILAQVRRERQHVVSSIGPMASILTRATHRGISRKHREAMTRAHGDDSSRYAGSDRVGDGLFSPDAYARDDESSDDRFYVAPRKVVHIDDGAIAALGRLYSEVLPTGGRLLDLMSSWRSHLPERFQAREVVGLGLNAEEMTDNPRLTRSIVHDLNRTPRLPFGNEEFDGAMCAVSARDLAHQRQPQSGPGALSAVGKPVERAEHILALRVRNARSMVADAQLDRALGAAHAHVDGRRAVAPRVLQEIPDHPA